MMTGIVTPLFEHLAKVSVAGLAGLCLTGCAGLAGGSSSESDAPQFLDPTMSMQTATDFVAIGKTTQAEVIAALGPAVVVKFDSGYEVWVYRAPAPGATGRTATSATNATKASQAEFVILFAPSGLVKKTRVRPANTP